MASHNKGGPYLRMRSVPTNPNTVRQQAVRNALGSLVNVWTDVLTQVQRDGWETYAGNVPVTDKLGETINLSGQNWYVGINTARLQAGLPRVDAAPTTFNQGVPVQSIAATNAGTADVIGINGADMSTDLILGAAAPDDGDIILFIGPPVNSSRNYFKGPYQLVDVIAVASAATSVAWGTTITALFNANTALNTGQKRALRARIAYDDGRLSPAFNLLTTTVDDV